jgi:general secretion pathway protein H
LELLVVVAVVAMVMATMPTLYGAIVPSYRVRQFANEIADKARELRAQSQVNSAIYTMAFVQGGEAYQVGSESVSGPSGVTLNFEPAFSWKISLLNELEFYPNGASSGGTVTVKRGNVEAQVDIDWMTGGVMVDQ